MNKQLQLTPCPEIYFKDCFHNIIFTILHTHSCGLPGLFYKDTFTFEYLRTQGLLCNRDRESISLHALLGTYGVELRELLYQREELTALITKAIQQDYYVILDTNDLENVHKPDANEVRAQSQYHFILIIGVDTQGRQMIVYDSKFRNTLNYGIFPLDYDELLQSTAGKYALNRIHLVGLQHLTAANPEPKSGWSRKWICHSIKQLELYQAYREENPLTRLDQIKNQSELLNDIINRKRLQCYFIEHYWQDSELSCRLEEIYQAFYSLRVIYQKALVRRKWCEKDQIAAGAYWQRIVTMERLAAGRLPSQ